MSESLHKHVILVGVGNIGSHVVPHLARMPQVSRVTLIDHDTYEASNVQSQDILPTDKGRPKAAVQARRLRHINPDIHVDAVVDRIENVPAGHLECDLILAGLDSMRARLVVNERARLLGIPWIDAGVDGENLLVRINVHSPGHYQPCAECGFSEDDYQIVEQEHPCSPSTGGPPATNAPSSVGGLAASLLAIECRKALAGGIEQSAGTQVLMDLATYNYYVGRRVVNPECRLRHDDVIPEDQPTPCPDYANLQQIVPTTTSADTPTLQVVGQSFVTRLTCTECARTRSFLRLRSSLRARPYKCVSCGGPMLATGFDTIDRLDETSLTSSFRYRPLRNMGVREGDILRIASQTGRAKFFIATGASSNSSGGQHG